MIVMLIFLAAYWLSGKSTLHELRDILDWGTSGPPNTVLISCCWF